MDLSATEETPHLRTRVGLLCTFIVMMVVISSCTVSQIRSYNRSLGAAGEVTIPINSASDFKNGTSAPAKAQKPAPKSTAAKPAAPKTAKPAATQAAAAKFARLAIAERTQKAAAAQERSEQRQAAMKAADRRATAKRQSEVTAALQYLAAKAEAEAAAADPYGYGRVAHYVSDAGLKRLRDCESTDRYYITNPSGKYRGAYQFDLPTWNGVAARWFPHLAGVDPVNASPEAQDAMTRALWSERGRYPWPKCGLRV